MCHPDPPAVIVVSDSDRDDGSQSDTSIVSLVNSLSTAKASGTATRQRPTGSQLHEVIVIDCDDESSDTPLVRF
jgi:hypothetical protein